MHDSASGMLIGPGADYGNRQPCGTINPQSTPDPLGFHMRIALIFLLMALAVLSAAAAEDRYARSEPHMGVEFEVVLYASDAKQADEALTKAMDRIAALDKALSDYDLESELSKL